jgi:hypothetical protein
VGFSFTFADMRWGIRWGGECHLGATSCANEDVESAAISTSLPAPSNTSDAKIDKLMAMVEKQNNELSGMKAELAQVRKEKMREREAS